MIQQVIEFVLSHPRAIPVVLLAFMAGLIIKDPRGYLK